MGFYADKLFPWILDISEPKEMAQYRRSLLKDVSGKVLEIGFGTGANLPYYPQSIRRITVVDPSSAMRTKAAHQIQKSGIAVEWHQSYGESLPFEDDEFDTVVTTDVLCGVRNVELVLTQVFRVLKTNGRYFFLEHGISAEPKIRRWQTRLNGISKAVACGCTLTRDIEQQIRTSPLAVHELKLVPRFSGPNALYSHIQGSAYKPA